MPKYLSGDTDDAEPEETGGDVRYDLAGNPLPRAARPAAASPVGLDEPSPLRPVSAPPPRPSAEPPPPRPDFGAPAAWTPPPGYVSPPGFNLAPPPKPQVSSVSGTSLYAVLGVVVVGVIALTFALHNVKPKMVPAPASYKAYTALDGSFVCDRPVGWKTKEAGSPGGSRAMVSFESDKVVVEIEADASRLMTASAGDTNAGNTNPYASTPIAKVMPLIDQMHQKDVAQWMDVLPNFQEKPAEPYTSKFGEARVSEWTASKGNIKLHGYRVTMAGTDRAISVFCLTPERNWKILQPAFQRIITSIGPEGGQSSSSQSAPSQSAP